MSLKMFAAIDIGSSETTMKIYEFTGKNKMNTVDTVSKRIALGSDTYSYNKVSPEKVDELCRTLKEFLNIMSSYKITAYKAYGTSAIREAENSLILLDQIEQRTGIKVEVLSNSGQRFLDYKSIASKGDIFKQIIGDKTAILDIGGGSIQISLFENDTLVSTQNLRLGVLRIQERLSHMNVRSQLIEKVVDEMVYAQLDVYRKLYLKDREIRNIIILDDYISPWALKRATLESREPIRNLEQLNGFMQMLKNNSIVQISKTMGITEDKVPLCIISTILVNRIVNLMGAETLWLPGVTLCDGIAFEYAEKNKLLQDPHDFEKDIVACAMNISKRYMGSKKRSETLVKISTSIFDGMKKVHGFGKREKLYLQIAAILHDCGKYVSLINVGETSYNIIMATEIIGLSHQEREIVASIVRYNHTKFEYYDSWTSTGLDRESYLVVAKLVAILRLANALDRSHKEKMKSLKTTQREDELLIAVDSQEDITLESGYFEASASFFKEVYSINPVLKQKKSI